jgi:preprotein translocase SecE subunit
MNSLVTYLKNVRAEMAHVVWPTNKTALNHVALVVAISIFAALYIAALDYAFTHGVSKLLGG